MRIEKNNAPLVTMGFLTHCREKYVREAVRSVLAQTYSPLQIVVCDDASTDSTPDIVAAELSAYRGPHDTVFHRNDVRMGIGNYNRLMTLTEGELIVVAHDDDISRPDRVERLVAAWRQSKASLLSSNGIRISEDGREHGLFASPQSPKSFSAEDFVTREWSPWMWGGALAWERKVFDVWGPLNPAKSAISTDWILPFRASLMGGIAVVDEPLLKIRVHPGSRTFAVFGDSKDFALQEINLSHELTQFYYMLDTLDQPPIKDLIPNERRENLRLLVLRTILTKLDRWRVCRNQLFAAGYRVRWVPPA